MEKANLQNDLLEKIESARTIPRATFELGQLTKALGFDFWCYGQASYQNLAKHNVTLHNNYPPAWRQRYQEKQYASVDPVIAQGLHCSKSFVWNDALYAETPELWNEARTFGLNKGWSQSARHANPSTVGILSLVRREKSISSAEVEDKQRQLHWLAHVVHAKMSALQAKKTQLTLTERELLVMRWTANGKTASEIADILMIKERAVTFHINNIVLRLGVQNKTAAAVQLAMNGLLY
jgi:LuxR family transcriptional regulator, quorum-sensing system regulator SolR